MIKSTKYISQLSDEELREMLLFYLNEMIDQYQKDRGCLDLGNMVLQKNKNGNPVFFDYKNAIKGFKAEAADYSAKVRVFGSHLDVTYIHRQYMYRKFGQAYLDDLKNVLEEPALTRLKNIAKELQEIKSQVSLSDEMQ